MPPLFKKSGYLVHFKDGPQYQKHGYSVDRRRCWRDYANAWLVPELHSRLPLVATAWYFVISSQLYTLIICQVCQHQLLSPDCDLCGERLAHDLWVFGPKAWCSLERRFVKIMMSVAAEPILWQQCGNWGTLLAENWCRDIEAVCFIEGNIWWNCMHLGSCQTWFEFFAEALKHQICSACLLCLRQRGTLDLFAARLDWWENLLSCSWSCKSISKKNQLMHERLSIALQPRYDQETGWLVLILMLGQIAVDCWKLTRVIEAWAHTHTQTHEITIASWVCGCVMTITWC